MIKKHLRNLVIVNVVVLLGIGVLYFYQLSKPEHIVESPSLVLVNRDFMDVETIVVQNQYGEYMVQQEEGGFFLEGVSSDIIDPEHLKQLIAHSAFISFDKKIEDAVDLSLYGFDQSEAQVRIQYQDGQVMQLLIGKEGPLTNTYYVLDQIEQSVYLFKKANVVRYLYDKKHFVNKIIVEPNHSVNVMDSIQYVRYSGKEIPRDITIIKLDPNNDKQMVVASSFGALSHLMLEPTLQKVDIRQAQDQFLGIVGLLSKEVMIYDASQADLAAYGFDDPDMKIEYQFSLDGMMPAQNYLLEVAYKDNQPYVMLNRNGVIHAIEDETFLHVSYEKLISRWFYTPLLLDVSHLKIQSANQTYQFEIEKIKENQIKVYLNNQEVDSDAFRKFYNLVVSASHDGSYKPFERPNQALLDIEFTYYEASKTPDKVSYYPGDARRHQVCFNETCDFAIKESFVSLVDLALRSIAQGQDFEVNWE